MPAQKASPHKSHKPARHKRAGSDSSGDFRKRSGKPGERHGSSGERSHRRHGGHGDTLPDLVLASIKKTLSDLGR